MTRQTDLKNDLDDDSGPIDPPAGRAEPSGERGPSAEGGDLASTDMSAEPSSRTPETQPVFRGGRPSRIICKLRVWRAELADRAQASFVAKLIDVLDDLDRLVASDPSTPLPSLREGLSAVDRKLWKQLEDAGVERIDPVGTTFDPALHEAVSTTPATNRSQEHIVSATFQPGYRFKGTLVRPARVQVYSDPGQH